MEAVKVFCPKCGKRLFDLSLERPPGGTVILPLMKSLGIADEQNRIDVDLLYEEVSKNLEAHPFNIGPYKPDKTDLDKLREIMNRHGEQP